MTVNYPELRGPIAISSPRRNSYEALVLSGRQTDKTAATAQSGTANAFHELRSSAVVTAT